MPKTSKTNPPLPRVVRELREVSREAGAPVWRDVADRLERSRRNWSEVNLSRLSRYASKGARSVVLGEYRARRGRGSTTSRMRGIGPFYPRRADMLLRRTISRMLPHQQARGRDALKRLRVYLSVPDEFKDKPLEIVEVAKR